MFRRFTEPYGRITVYPAVKSMAWITRMEGKADLLERFVRVLEQVTEF